MALTVCRYGSGTLTKVFVDRVFQECLTYDGEMVGNIIIMCTIPKIDIGPKSSLYQTSGINQRLGSAFYRICIVIMENCEGKQIENYGLICIL